MNFSLRIPDGRSRCSFLLVSSIQVLPFSKQWVNQFQSYLKLFAAPSHWVYRPTCITRSRSFVTQFLQVSLFMALYPSCQLRRTWRGLWWTWSCHLRGPLPWDWILRSSRPFLVSESSAAAHSWFHWYSAPGQHQFRHQRGISRTHSIGCSHWYSSKEDTHQASCGCFSCSLSYMIPSSIQQMLGVLVFFTKLSGQRVALTGR